jgi:hypothetical protein
MGILMGSPDILNRIAVNENNKLPYSEVGSATVQVVLARK